MSAGGGLDSRSMPITAARTYTDDTARLLRLHVSSHAPGRTDPGGRCHVAGGPDFLNDSLKPVQYARGG